VIKTVGAVPPVSKINPAGAFRMLVPTPALPFATSAYTGPVSAVYAPPVLSAEIAPPPVAGVTVCAYAVPVIRQRNPRRNTTCRKTYVMDFRYGTFECVLDRYPDV
jgi:hypothetical protein